MLETVRAEPPLFVTTIGDETPAVPVLPKSIEERSKRATGLGSTQTSGPEISSMYTPYPQLSSPANFKKA